MAIKNKFIHFNTRAGFDAKMPTPTDSTHDFFNYTVFIKDTQEIYTHGQFYDCSEYDDSDIRKLISDLTSEVDTKQDLLVSNTNIKTINGQSVLGSGDIVVGNIVTEDSSSELDDVEVATFVKYVTQSLTDTQKAQARTNIGAASVSDLSGYVITSFTVFDLLSIPVGGMEQIQPDPDDITALLEALANKTPIYVAYGNDIDSLIPVSGYKEDLMYLQFISETDFYQVDIDYNHLGGDARRYRIPTSAATYETVGNVTYVSAGGIADSDATYALPTSADGTEDKILATTDQLVWIAGTGTNSAQLNTADTVASGMASTAEGTGTTASGKHSHAEGVGSQATEFAAHAEGEGSIASGMGSHAEGSSTEAIGECSHAEGLLTDANGDYSHAEGSSTVTNNAAEHAEGTFNVSIASVTRHTVGIGDSTARKNAHLITSDGKHYIPNVGSYVGTESTSTALAACKDVATVINSKVDLEEFEGLNYAVAHGIASPTTGTYYGLYNEDHGQADRFIVTNAELKTINGSSIFGSGNLTIDSGSVTVAQSTDYWLNLSKNVCIYHTMDADGAYIESFPTATSSSEVLNCGLILDCSVVGEGALSIGAEDVEVLWANDTFPTIEVGMIYEIWFTSYNMGTTWFAVYTSYPYTAS